MSSQRRAPSPQQTTASSPGGCLSGFLLPPLAVVCVGTLLSILLLGSTTGISADASPPETGALQSGLAPSVDGGAVSPVFTPEVQYWARSIESWTASAGLDPNLAATVMQIESCGDPHALSRAGAMGLFQVMPYHFAAGEDPYAPAVNAKRGLAYLARSLEAAGGDARLALAGYNGGIGVIGQPESSWKAETQRYAYWGSGIYADASSGLQASPRLDEWLASNGLSLCRQAGQRLGILP
jgi:hypothetical protein